MSQPIAAAASSRFNFLLSDTSLVAIQDVRNPLPPRHSVRLPCQQFPDICAIQCAILRDPISLLSTGSCNSNLKFTRAASSSMCVLTNLMRLGV